MAEISTEPTNTQAALAAEITDREITDRPDFAQRLSVGQRIANGSTVLRSALLKDHGDHAEYAILALSHDEFVTWILGVRPDGTNEAFWGHYFQTDLAGALADYVERSSDR